MDYSKAVGTEEDNIKITKHISMISYNKKDTLLTLALDILNTILFLKWFWFSLVLDSE